MRQIILLFFSVLFSLTVVGQEEGIVFMEQDWEKALEKAKTEDKLVFVDAYTSWCKPCKEMDQKVFPQKIVGEFFEKNFISVKVNTEKEGKGKALQEKYEILYYPTFLFLEGDGSQVHRMAGYQSAPKLIDLGIVAMNPNNRLSSLMKRYEDGDRDSDFLLTYLGVLSKAMDGSQIVVAEEYLNTQGDWNTEANRKFIFKQVSSVDSKLFDHVVENRAAYEEQFGAVKVTGQVEKLIYEKIYDDKGNASLDALDSLFAKVYPADRAAKSSARFKLNYFYEKGQGEKYADEALKYFKKYPNAEASELTDAAWNFYELGVTDKKKLKKARKWAKGAFAKEGQYLQMDTLAAIYFQMKKKRKAIKAARKAIGLAKESGEDHSETDELLKKIYAL